jgi:hypothetical protein
LVSEKAFDAFTRHAADAVSRRNSLLALGGMALAAGIAEPAIAKKKSKNQAKKKCRRQVPRCKSYFAGFCLGDPDCEAELFPCCEFLAKCDPGSMLDCLFTCGCEGLPGRNVSQ